ncbi:unnamed protein product [Cuscuta campestris]|uniref:BED-type domain-containing protein n=1 Tax=Cuscuta campestris TaxID=132261 RepID=A0A484MQ21_9ASTE|nr:unnamed protein product [Cuscuta campestris]
MQWGQKRRSTILKEFIILLSSQCVDGKRRAQCSHCKKASFLADSYYGTSNMKRHLDKCQAYQQSLTNNEDEKEALSKVSKIQSNLGKLLA